MKKPFTPTRPDWKLAIRAKGTGVRWMQVGVGWSNPDHGSIQVKLDNSPVQLDSDECWITLFPVAEGEEHRFKRYR